MTEREKKYLHDVIESIELIESFTSVMIAKSANYFHLPFSFLLC